MLPRFFAPGAGRSAAESAIVLPGDESAHIARVLRLAIGDSIRVFDGEGGEWRAEITEVARRRVVVSLREAVAPAQEARVPLLLALAVLKGDKMDAVVRDAVMLGASAIQPLVTERTEISLAALARSQRVDRWQRIALSSCKQCGRAVVPLVRATQIFDEWNAQPPQGTRLMLVEPGVSGQHQAIHDVAAPSSAEVVVGPEGGWTAREIESGEDAGARLVTLGALTLRADAVPVVALTALRTVWRDF